MKIEKWRLAENDQTLVMTEALDEDGNARVVADVLNMVGHATDENFFDAKLIALAPELLEYVASSASAGCATAKLLVEKLNK